MTAEVAVMYSREDPARAGKHLVRRVPIEDVDLLPKTGVLFIVVSQLDSVNPRLNGARRMSEAWGKDRYALVVRREWHLLYGFDDGDFQWRRHAVEPFAEASSVTPDHLPLSVPSVTFEGAQLGTGPDDPLWIAALKQFNEELH